MDGSVCLSACMILYVCVCICVYLYVSVCMYAYAFCASETVGFRSVERFRTAFSERFPNSKFLESIWRSVFQAIFERFEAYLLVPSVCGAVLLIQSVVGDFPERFCRVFGAFLKRFRSVFGAVSYRFCSIAASSERFCWSVFGAVLESFSECLVGSMRCSNILERFRCASSVLKTMTPIPDAPAWWAHVGSLESSASR